MNEYYIYSETAFHHEGDLDFLKKLVNSSKEAGVKGVKFQVLTNPNDFISTKHSSFDALSSYCFNKTKWREILNYTKSLDLDIIIMPLNLDAVSLCDEFDVKFLEIHSVSFRDKNLHRRVKDSKIDLILGAGGRNKKEIDYLLEYYVKQVKILMVGFQSFPSNLSDIKLDKISYLNKMYPHLKVGYADHSAYGSDDSIKSNEYAYLLGARVFEKHITILESKERIDSASAVSKDSISYLIKRLSFIRDEILIRKEDIFNFTDAEIRYRERELRIVASKNIRKGETIDESYIRLKMIDNENAISDLSSVIGKQASQDINFDEPILINNLH